MKKSMQQLKLYCRVIFCISIVVTHNSFADDQLIKIYNYISHDLLLSYNLKVYITGQINFCSYYRKYKEILYGFQRFDVMKFVVLHIIHFKFTSVI